VSLAHGEAALEACAFARSKLATRRDADYYSTAMPLRAVAVGIALSVDVVS
jgi:hypothetical protein